LVFVIAYAWDMKKEAGFSVVIILILVVVVAVVGFAGYNVLSRDKTSKSSTQTSQQSSSVETSQATSTQSTPSSCGDRPVIALPVDSKRLESVLYPGQVRGNNFKPHGGFRLNGTNDAKVTLPADAKVIDGVRYIEAGELQYMFDFETSCGYRIRLDHLNTLSAEMQKIAETLPAATEDSRTTNVENVEFKAGDVIATKIGFTKMANRSFDFGFYNMKEQNDASKAGDWPKGFEYQTELATHAVCWFDYLSDEDEALIRGLPAGDGIQGKSSVYCK